MKTSVVTTALILFLTTATAWPQTRTELNVIYPAISGINAPLWYATEQNLFQKYGLDVELIYIPTALQVTRVVLTGDSQIAFSGGAPVEHGGPHAAAGADFVRETGREGGGRVLSRGHLVDEADLAARAPSGSTPSIWALRPCPFGALRT